MGGRSFVRAALLCSVVLGSTNARGQARPPGTQPGQIEKQFERPPQPSAKPGAITIPKGGQQPPENAEGVKFVLKQLTVEGATVYRPDALRAAYAPLIDREVTLADVYRVAERLTAMYRNDGYILSQVFVPAQVVEAGAIRLQAVQGYIATVTVQGGSAALRNRIRKYGDKIRASRPLTMAALERYVLLVNDLPGVAAHAILSTSNTAGASDLILQVSQRRLSSTLNSDNRGSEAQGPARLAADLDAHALMGTGSRTELRAVTTFSPELAYVALAHDQFVGAEGAKIGLAASYVYSKPQELAIVPLHLTTTSVMFTASISQAIVRRRSHNLYVRGMLSSFDSTTKVFGVDDTIDHVRSASLGLTFDEADRAGGVSVVDVAFTQGLPWLGASKSGGRLLSRPTGRADFRKVTLYAQRLQNLPGQWSILAGVDGQYAFSDLLASEMFSIGGELFGRGYDPSALLNDEGAAAKLELRYQHIWGARRLVLLMPYVFGERGTVWQRTSLPGVPRSAQAASVGGGLRVGVGNQFSGFVEIDRPLDPIPGVSSSRDTRLYVGVSVR
jgi:hemolysin activation/secretion protein